MDEVKQVLLKMTEEIFDKLCLLAEENARLQIRVEFLEGRVKQLEEDKDYQDTWEAEQRERE